MPIRRYDPEKVATNIYSAEGAEAFAKALNTAISSLNQLKEKINVASKKPKYKLIPESLLQQEKYQHAYCVRDNESSSLEIRSQSNDWTVHPLYCVDCPVKNVNPMNPSQMADHMELVHAPRGDIVWNLGYFQALAKAYKDWKKSQLKENA